MVNNSYLDNLVVSTSYLDMSKTEKNSKTKLASISIKIIFSNMDTSFSIIAKKKSIKLIE